MMGMTERQRACLKAISAFRKRERRMPSLSEICAEMGMSSRSAVSGLLARLEQRGHIKRIPNAARAILLRRIKCPYCKKDILVSK